MQIRSLELQLPLYASSLPDHIDIDTNRYKNHALPKDFVPLVHILHSLSSMSEGSQSFTAQGSSTLDQSFEKEKAPALQQSTSIYDDGKAAWLTVAGTYVTSFIPGLNYTDFFFFTRTIQLDDTILHIRVDLCLSSFDTMASLWIGSIEVCISLRCIPRLLYEGILEPRDTVEHKVR